LNIWFLVKIRRCESTVTFIDTVLFLWQKVETNIPAKLRLHRKGGKVFLVRGTYSECPVNGQWTSKDF